MRKLISGLFIALDGVVEAPYLWQFFADGSALKRMKLVGSTITNRGVAVLTYQRYHPEAA